MNWKRKCAALLCCFVVGVTFVSMIFWDVEPASCITEKTSQKNRKEPIPLSGEAAKLVAEHLGEVVRQLRDGGPPHWWGEREEDKKRLANWSVEQVVASYSHVATPEYPKGYDRKHYLDDYRRTFLTSWDYTFRKEVTLNADGTASLGYWTCLSPYQPTGMTNGFYDGRRLAGDFIDRARDNEQTSKYDPAVDLDPALREAVIYIRKYVIGGPSPLSSGKDESFIPELY